MSESRTRPLGRPPKPVAAPPVHAVSSACALLRAFSVEQPTLTLTEMAAKAKLHKSTCLRLAASLIAEGLLARDEDGRFRVGPFAYFLGKLHSETADLPRLVTPELSRLAQESGESASLYVREGHERVLMLRVPSSQSVRDFLDIGARLPLHLGASGKILCAFGEPPADLPAAVREELTEIRRLGFASSFGEREAQVSSVAVPLWRAKGVLVGALALSGPRTRLTKRHVPSASRLLLDAAARLSVAFGYRDAPGIP